MGKIELIDVEVVVNPVGKDESERARFDLLSPELSFAIYAGILLFHFFS